MILPECVEEVGGGGGGKELDTKLVYSEIEVGGQGYMGPKTGGVRHRSVALGLEVADEGLVGDDAGFLSYLHPLSDFDVDIAALVGDGEEGVLNDHLIRCVFQVYPHVLVVCHRVIKVIIDYVRRQVAGPFSGVGDDGVEVDLEVEKADCWGAGVTVVGEFVATDC